MRPHKLRAISVGDEGGIVHRGGRGRVAWGYQFTYYRKCLQFILQNICN